MAMELFAELDPASNAAIARLANPALLDPALINMLQQSAEDMQQRATAYMQSVFIQARGGVENAWEIEVTSPELATLTNTAPYARRLDLGFSGMTDALGRTYTAWPIAYPDGYHWADAAVAAVQPEVEDVFRLGFEHVLGVG